MDASMDCREAAGVRDMRVPKRRAILGWLSPLMLLACDRTESDLPTRGKAHSSAYELGFEVSKEVANGVYPLPSDHRWLARAEKADVRGSLGPIAEEIGDFVSISSIVCNDIMPLEGKDYPVRVRCWADVQNKCKRSKIVVVVASENGRWDDSDWGILGFGMQRSLVEQSKC
jgi:hypothetical protein